MKWIGVILLILVVSSDAVQLSSRVSSKLRSMQPLLDDMKAQSSLTSELEAFTKYALARSARWEAAIGLATNSDDLVPAERAALQEILRRLVALAISMKTDKSKWDLAICDVFNLPGGTKDTKSFEEFKDKPEQLKAALERRDNELKGKNVHGILGGSISMDAFSLTDLNVRRTKSLEYVQRVIADGNIRELVMLLMYASEYCEDNRVDFLDLDYDAVCPGSFRHILYQLHQNKCKVPDSNLAGFACDHLKNQFDNYATKNPPDKNKKTVLSPSVDGWISKARPGYKTYYKLVPEFLKELKGGKWSPEMKQEYPKAGFRYTRVWVGKDTFNKKHETSVLEKDKKVTNILAKYDNELLAALGMPPRNDHELNFYYKSRGETAKPNGEVWMGSGLYRQVIPNDAGSLEANEDLKKWRAMLDGNFLSMANGPSGSSEEYSQMADFFGLTKDPYFACNLRGAIMSNMIFQAHHSYEEIVEGFEPVPKSARINGLKSHIGKDKTEPDDAFRTLTECGGAKKPANVTPLKWAWPDVKKAPTFTTETVYPGSGNIYAVTKAKFEALNADIKKNGKLIQAVMKTPKFAITNDYQTQAVDAANMGLKMTYDDIKAPQISKACKWAITNAPGAWKPILESEICSK